VWVIVGVVIRRAWQPPAAPVDTLSPRLSSKFMGSIEKRPEMWDVMSVVSPPGISGLPFYFADRQQFLTLGPRM